MWKAISIVAFVLVIGVGVKWVADGAEVFTKNKKQVTQVDPMFGTETVTWKEGFWLGLDMAGPAMLVLLGVGGFGLYRMRQDSEAQDNG